MAITGLRALQQYILREVLKDSPKGVMTTLPNKDLIEINVQVLAQRLMQGGIDPTKLKNANQVENAIKMINDRSNVQTGFTTKKSADVFDLEGKKIDPKKGIMGGKQIPDDDLPPPGSRGGPDDIAAPVQSSEETIKDMIEAENKKGIANIQKRILEEDREIENLYSSAGFGKDQKIDAEFLAEYLAENAGKVYDDLPTKERLNFYDRAFNALTRYKRTKGTSVIDEPKKLDSRTKEKMDDMKDIEDPEDMAQGGRAGFKLGTGKKGIQALLDFFNKKSPLQFGKDYLKDVKDKTLKANETGKFMDLPLAEVGIPATTGALITNQLRKKLEAMNEEQKEQFLKEFIEELNADPFYQEYPELKDKTIAGYTERLFGEKRAEGGRIGYKIGSIDKARRAFLKAAAGFTGGIAALKTGLLNIGKGADTVKNLPPIKTPVTKLEGTTTEMPEWFPSFINKFRDEGKAKDVFKTKKVEVSKEEFDQAFKEGKGENYFSDVARTPEYKANNPDHMDYYKRVDTDERIYTTYTNDKVPGVRVDDMDGNVDVMFENEYSQPVSLNYTAPGKRGPETGRADVFVQGEAKMEPKPKGEFVANDVEVYATDPDGGSESVDVIANTVDDMLEGKTRQMEEYATGKKTKLSRGEGRVIEAEVRAEQAADAAADMADDFASGGIARMLGE